MTYVEYKTSKPGNVGSREADTQLLHVLSEPLRVALSQEKCEPYLIGHPFFCKWATVSHLAMGGICAKAVHLCSFSAGDVVFADGTKASGMFIMLSGTLMYYFRGELGQEGTALSTGTWCSEAALWTEWLHVGLMRASENAEVMLVHSTRFIEQARSFPSAFQAVVSYSREYVHWLNREAEFGELTDISMDICQVQSLADKAFRTDTTELPGEVELANDEQWWNVGVSEPTEDGGTGLVETAMKRGAAF